MKLTKKNAETVQKAIQTWRKDQVIDKDTSDILRDSIQVIPFDWIKLAKYSICTSLICLLIAIGSLLADRIFMAMIEHFFNAPALAKFLFCSGLAILFLLRNYAQETLPA